MRARYYDPETGQFVTRDPLEGITRQPYSYAGGDQSMLRIRGASAHGRT